MDENRYPRQWGPSSREPLERRLDQLIETGRQFVDGVAGNRPGKRRAGRNDRRPERSFETVGRWVGDKIDWFLEDNGDMSEPWPMDQKESRKYESKNFRDKRPLDAISKRGTHAITKEAELRESAPIEDKWPDDSIFKVNRWQRGFGKNNPDSLGTNESGKLLQRRLPRSSRRRY